MMLAIAAELDYKIYMIQVQTSFFNADMEEGFVKMLPRYEHSNTARVSFLMKCKKSFTDFGKASRTGLIRWISASTTPNFDTSDRCVYVYEDGVGFSF